VGGSSLDISIASGLSLPDSAVLDWIDASARAVTAYFGRYPVPELRLAVRAGAGRGVRHGITYGGRAPSIRIEVGRAASEDDLHEDWVLTHEMAHLGFPDLTSDDSWAEEGLSTYVEPLARARVGTVSVEKVWSDLIEGLPRGLPERGDGGLHGTEEWGRTYWGGALFWFLADVQIREATQNRRGLPDALGGILAAGGDIRAHWELRRALETGDRAVGLTVLSDLYRRMGSEPMSPDLAELWRKLGIQRSAGHVRYDDTAPLASVRKGIATAR
jgi:hypothetical protein